MSQPAPPRRNDDKPWRSEGAPPSPPPKRPISWGRLIVTAIIVFLLANVLFNVYGGSSTTTITYTEFTKQLAAGNVSDIYAKGDAIQGDLKKAVDKPDDGRGTYTKFSTQRPSFANDNLWSQIEKQNVQVKAEPVTQQRSFLSNLLLSLLPILVLVGLWVWMARRVSAGLGGAGGGLGGIGRRNPPKPVEAAPGGQRTTFADVAGIDEVRDELTDIVDFLKNPDRYRKMGAKMPKGVLLAGPPGTGKTLLARAVAGEAEVPFFSASASEFIEMIVGVGASRVRELFTEARKVAPSIIFIDEIDTIGRARGGGGGLGGHDEREQTLNQILTEMDGFTGSEGVVVVAATNRADVLDPALLRPGRFDRTVTVSPPDRKGREQILKIHTREIPLANDVDFPALAKMTPGMTGADLANLANEAALRAVKGNEKTVDQEDFSQALEKVQLGTERAVVIPDAERRLTAYHESGHALLGMLQPGADPVRKITIVPRGRALGVTLSTPDTDKYSYTEEYLRGRIIGALGGMAAEQVVFGTITTGSESDLETVTNIARGMAGRWGMSPKVGRLNIIPATSDSPYALSAASDTVDEVDAEARRIVNECFEEAVRKLGENRDRLDALATALLENETLDEDAAYRAAGIPRAEGSRDESSGRSEDVSLLKEMPGAGAEEADGAAGHAGPGNAGTVGRGDAGNAGAEGTADDSEGERGAHGA
ncbi:ATP-dependent zinc metalloprotease FtsH [Mangrovactinospora gilvigrisea]|uniref:ATP-dependent zinc metalloprotease FtsH n=1 Tax=Mangrovactinospora gilvigrisea TaxID=1428644 RepID=UPI0009A10BCD|nr:ATP-dependent zinc metalloprotease FtsH [Mangrovactinospora gilvigrisea]